MLGPIAASALALAALSGTIGEPPAVSALAPAKVSQPATVTKFDFENVKAGGFPDGFRVTATNPQSPPATWEVVEDATAPSPKNALALTKTNHDSRRTLNICWNDKVMFKDGAIEVKIKPTGGKGDTGGGVIWRAKDADNYYLCRFSPEEGNFRLYVCKDGKRAQLADAKVKPAMNEWHSVSITHRGEHITCTLDGENKIEAENAVIPEQGGVGVWAKGDSLTEFDDLVVRAEGGGAVEAVKPAVK